VVDEVTLSVNEESVTSSTLATREERWRLLEIDHSHTDRALDNLSVETLSDTQPTRSDSMSRLHSERRCGLMMI